MSTILQASDVEVLPDPIRGWLAKNARPPGYKGWWPVTDAQGAALDCRADILLLGGSAGSMKTSSILIDLLQERDYPRMNAYFFRKTFPELEDAIQQAYDLFPQTGATYNSSDHTWYWPGSGAHFRFRHLSHEKNLHENQGKAMSAIGIDESTHIPMDWIRYLVTRNRSTDPNLFVRLRLGTNPGNISSKDHQKMFFNSVCPHCEPEKAPPQGIPRYGGKWHDGIPLEDKESGTKLSIAYILSSVRDHNLLGADYIARLKMQKPATAKALLAGCWRLFEGLYYDIWDYASHVVPIQKIPQEWYAISWVSGDYGYAGSMAAAHLFTRATDGTIYCIAEHPIGELANRERETVRTFAKSVYEKFAKKQEGQEQARNIEAMYLGPDSWNDRGDEHTLAGQMNDELDLHGLAFTKANNDRAGGSQLLYSMLESGEFKVADSCRNTIEMFESRIHDEKEPVKVQKVISDPLDDVFDSCAARGTLVATARGDVPIEEVTTDDLVWTRVGLRRVLWSGQTGWAVPTMLVRTASGRSLEATPSHKLWVDGYGWSKLDSMTNYGYYLLSCARAPHRSTRLSSFKGTSSIETGMDTFIPTALIGHGESNPSIGKYGSPSMGPSPKAMLSTIKTEIEAITTRQTWKRRLQHDTPRNTGTTLASANWRESISPQLHIWLRPGTVPRREERITADAQRKRGSNSPKSSRNLSACTAGRNSPRPTQGRTATAPMPATQRCEDENSLIERCRESAASAGGIFLETGSSRPKLARDPVVLVSGGMESRDEMRADVFNLVVEEAHEYIANGILSKNCRYGLYSYMEANPKPKEMQIKEKLKAIMESSQDKDMALTSAVAHYKKALKKEEQEDDDEQSYIGGNARRH